MLMLWSAGLSLLLVSLSFHPVLALPKLTIEIDEAGHGTKTKDDGTRTDLDFAKAMADPFSPPRMTLAYKLDFAVTLGDAELSGVPPLGTDSGISDLLRFEKIGNDFFIFFYSDLESNEKNPEFADVGLPANRQGLLAHLDERGSEGNNGVNDYRPGAATVPGAARCWGRCRAGRRSADRRARPGRGPPVPATGAGSRYRRLPG